MSRTVVTSNGPDGDGLAGVGAALAWAAKPATASSGNSSRRRIKRKLRYFRRYNGAPCIELPRPAADLASTGSFVGADRRARISREGSEPQAARVVFVQPPTARGNL